MRRLRYVASLEREVGVVDSGGQGLVFIYEGFLSALTGEFIASERVSSSTCNHVRNDQCRTQSQSLVMSQLKDIKFDLLYRVALDKVQPMSKISIDEFRNYLNNLGDSLLVVNDDEIVKVHVIQKDQV